VTSDKFEPIIGIRKTTANLSLLTAAVQFVGLNICASMVLMVVCFYPSSMRLIITL